MPLPPPRVAEGGEPFQGSPGSQLQEALAEVLVTFHSSLCLTPHLVSWEQQGGGDGVRVSGWWTSALPRPELT